MNIIEQIDAEIDEAREGIKQLENHPGASGGAINIWTGRQRALEQLRTKMLSKGTPVLLTSWEVSRMKLQAASNSMTFSGHFSNGGAWDFDELETGSRWAALARKLSTDPTPWEPWTPADFPRATFRRTRP